MSRPVLYNIQLLRFLAASAILLTHTADLLFPGSRLVTAIPWTAGVDVFFVISGFIMTWMASDQFGKRAAAANFLRRRIIRIVPPYWFFTIVLAVVVLAAGGRVRNTIVDPTTITTSLLFIPWPRADGVVAPLLAQGWTLNFELFFYLAFAASMMLRRGLAVLAAAFIGLAAVHPLIPPEWFVLNFLSRPVIVEFIAGILLGRLYLRGVRIGPFGAAAFVAAAVSCFVLLPEPTSEYAYFAKHGVPAMLFAAGFILLPDAREPGVMLRAAKVGGDASYTMYLSHTLIVYPLVIAAQSVGLGVPWLVLALVLTVATGCAILFYHFAEAPFTRFLGRRFNARLSTEPAMVAP